MFPVPLMRGARSWSARQVALLSVVAALSSAQALAVDDAQTMGVLRWRSGPAVTAQQEPAAIADALGQASRSAGVHVLVQFQQPLSTSQHQQLEAAGLRLLSYVGDNAYFAAVAPGMANAAEVVAAAQLRCVLPIQPQWRLHPDLVAGTIHEWSIVERQDESEPGERQVQREQIASPQGSTCGGAEVICALYVMFQGDVRLADGVRLCEQLGGRVVSQLESINGLVLELPVSRIADLAAEDSVMWIEPPLPKFSELNNSNRARTGADIVQAPPYGLDGAGVSVMVYDGGTGLSTHNDFGGRHHNRDTSSLSSHSTHVAGTIGGSGAASSGLYRGMAPAVTLEAYGFEQEGGLHQGFLYTDPGDLEDDYHQAIATYGVDISNNSIGTNTAPNGYPCDWEGNYGATSVLIDTIVRGDGTNPLFSQPFRIVWANGNERQVTRCLGIEGYPSPYHSTAPPACAKNHITVGAMNSNDDSVTSFTSFGPADDGRMKPDVSGPGCQSDDDDGVTSCNSTSPTSYTAKCGTSMASPTVCGLGALMLQDYRAYYPSQPDFRNSTLKVLLAHTAVDLFNVGPDYQTGYGSVRVQPAIELMRSGNFVEAQVAQGQTYSMVVIVSPSDDALKVTLAWDDVPGTPSVSPALVNDLDLHVYDAANQRYYPWTLAPMSPAAPAVQTQANHVDNLEQVYIPDAAPGAYRVEIRGYNVPSGPQPFSVCATPFLVNCSPAGTANLDRPKYPCSAVASMRVIDCDLNTSDTVVDTVTVMMTSSSEPAGEPVLLTETDPASAAFVGTIQLSSTDSPGVLLIAPGDTITLTYNDADNGSGQPAVVTTTAVADCTGPLVVNVVPYPINAHDATINFNTDEPAQVTVRYGQSCSLLTSSQAAGGYRTSHSITLVGLNDGATYYYAIDAVDEAGNSTTADNGGNCFSFTTLEIPDYYTQLFTTGNDLDNRRLGFTPNGSVDYYLACAESITALPTDPNGATTITLSNDSYGTVNLTGGATVKLYGVSYSSIYIGSNGYITFTAGDTDSTESLADHFDTPRVSGLFDNLDPAQGGQVSWRQFSDRVAVTWLNVPERNSGNQNTFQIELFFDGRINISYLAIAANDGLAGLSRGLGLPSDFLASDLSALGPCVTYPPTAHDVTVEANSEATVNITLLANDEGLPMPPGALTYTVTSLPAHGTLTDPGAGAITSAPYTLVNYGHVVRYVSAVYYAGSDTFTFMADDGGTPPDGGESNEATVTVTVLPVPHLLYSYPLNSNPGWTAQGGWAFGEPVGGGSHNRDPISGYTGINVYGYNLLGDYPNGLAFEEFLTTTPIDCSAASLVEVRFWRRLGVEATDRARLYVSNDGTSWTQLWQNPATVSDAGWIFCLFDLSAVADHQASVYLRWGMGPTDATISYPGWNIDDVEIWGWAPPTAPPICRGDCNCDRSVGFADIDLFVAAIPNNQANWTAKYQQFYGALPPAGCWTNCDVNGNGNVGFDDIDLFVSKIPSACPN